MSSPKCPPDIRIFEYNKKKVVLRPSAPSWAVLNEDGISFLKMCTGELTVKEIAEEMDMDIKTTHEFIQSLQECKLLGEEEPAEMLLYQLHGIWLHVSDACNLTCLTCYQDSGKAISQDLTLEEITNLFSHMRMFKPENLPQAVILTGGEPLLRSDIWDICKKGKNFDLKIGLLTNGMLITEEVAQKIKIHANEVQISLDGMQHSNDMIRGKGSFQKIMDGISALLDVGVIPGVAIVATNLNYAEIPVLVQFLLDLNITRIQIRPLIYRGRGAVNRSRLAMTCKEYQSLIECIYEKGFSSHPDLLNVERFAQSIQTPANNARGCSAGWRMVSISTTGEVYPCIAAHIPEFLFGSIREKSFEDIWKNSKELDVWRTFDVNMSAHCGTCDWRNFCGGGCKLSAFLRCNQITAGDQYCEALKNLYHFTLLREATL